MMRLRLAMRCAGAVAPRGQLRLTPQRRRFGSSGYGAAPAGVLGRPPCTVSSAESEAGRRQRSLCTDVRNDPLLPRTVARQEDGGVRIEWGDGHASAFHERWLFEHCPLRTSGSGGQKAGPPAGRSRTVSSAAAAAGGESVVVEWSCGDTSTFAAAWLRAHCYSDAASEARSRQRDPLPHALGAADSVPSISYSDVMASEQGVLAWTANLERHGLCVVRGTPCEDGEVARLAARIAPVIPSLYGDYWNVRVEPDAINVAYTSQGLEPHMDLAYYESPPGIQLLNCMAFPSTVKGGESTFLDTFVLAELLREREPESFATLLRVPATFQKSHADRDFPAQMFYRRPHIVTDTGCPAGAVTAVFWSPPFEGPLCVPDEDVPAYYRAYDAMAALLKDEEVLDKHLITMRLGEGDTVTFNQRRLLHGRNAFELTAGMSRHLQGCYLNIDDFLSRHRALATVGQVRSDIEQLCLSPSQAQAQAQAQGGQPVWGVDWTARASNGSYSC